MSQKKPLQKKPVAKKPPVQKPKPVEKKPEPETKPEPIPEPIPETKTKPAAVLREDNTVFIGQKPVMNYVLACLTLFNAGGNEVTVKARGRAISRAVDTVELLRRSFVKDVGVKSINLGTEEVTREEGRKSNVSTMEITVAKTK
jgi:DNA-binding protein